MQRTVSCLLQECFVLRLRLPLHAEKKDAITHLLAYSPNATVLQRRALNDYVFANSETHLDCRVVISATGDGSIATHPECVVFPESN